MPVPRAGLPGLGQQPDRVPDGVTVHPEEPRQLRITLKLRFWRLLCRVMSSAALNACFWASQSRDRCLGLRQYPKSRVFPGR
ncbi:hypothetical protein SBBP2_1430005 [Burkholderiales bacterium]|nr:hypothetical protein SBBP2_1430005 [Burkholderiales bacterium]